MADDQNEATTFWFSTREACHFGPALLGPQTKRYLYIADIPMIGNHGCKTKQGDHRNR